MMKWYKKNHQVKYILVKLQELWKDFPLNKKKVFICFILYGIMVFSSMLGIIHYGDRLESLNETYALEKTKEEGEKAFLQSEGIQFVKAMEKRNPTIEQLYHLALQEIQGQPFILTYSHEEEDYCDIAVEGSTPDFIHWANSFSHRYPLIQWNIKRISVQNTRPSIQFRLSRKGKKESL